MDKALLYGIITLKEPSGQFIGNCTINCDKPKNRNGSLGITISKTFWGKGYAKEVLAFVLHYSFKSLALHRISLGVFESNVRAVKLYLKM